jgi:hypothetical protein
MPILKDLGASSTHGMQFPLLMLQKQIWVKEHCLFWLILVSMNLLNGQLKQQNVFIVPSLSTIVTSVVCQEAQKISQ